MTPRFRSSVPLIAICCTMGSSGPSMQQARAGYVLVANQQSASASLIDLQTDRMTLIPVGVGPHEAVISPSGRVGVVTIYGISGSVGNELAVIDIARGAVTKTISLGQYTRPHGANFFPGDESRVVVTSESTGNVVIVNLEQGIVEAAIPTRAGGSHMVALTGDGRRAWTANISSGSVSEMDTGTRQFVRTIAVGPRAEGIAVTPDGATVWAGSNTDGTVSIVDTRTGTVAKTLTGFTLPYRLAISSDGRVAIICDPEGDRVIVADVRTREVLWDLSGIGSPRGVNLSPDGKFAFVTLAADNSMGIVDLESRKLIRKVAVGSSPDGVWYGPVPR